MGEVEDFLESVLPRLKAADTALHNGDADPRIAMWSRTGAARPAQREVTQIKIDFERL